MAYMPQADNGRINFTNVADSPPRTVPKKGTVDFGDDDDSPPRPRQAEESTYEGTRQNYQHAVGQTLEPKGPSDCSTESHNRTNRVSALGIVLFCQSGSEPNRPV